MTPETVLALIAGGVLTLLSSAVIAALVSANASLAAIERSSKKTHEQWVRERFLESSTKFISTMNLVPQYIRRIGYQDRAGAQSLYDLLNDSDRGGVELTASVEVAASLGPLNDELFAWLSWAINEKQPAIGGFEGRQRKYSEKLRAFIAAARATRCALNGQRRIVSSMHP